MVMVREYGSLYINLKKIIPAFDMNLMQNSYRDNRDIELHYRDIRIFIIAQPYMKDQY